MTPAAILTLRLHRAGYDWQHAVKLAARSNITATDLAAAAHSARLTFAGQPKPRADRNAAARAKAERDLG